MLLIELRRRELKLSQSKLGRIAEVRQPLISQIESGRYRPSADQLERLGRVLAVPGEQLLTPLSVTRFGDVVVVLPDNGRPLADAEGRR